MSFDLDYIFKWVDPIEPDVYVKFWVAPVTMVFENAVNIKFDTESQQGLIEIADLLMGNPKFTPNEKFTEYTFRFECQEGKISLQATGFKMYVRQAPILTRHQSLEFKPRGELILVRWQWPYRKFQQTLTVQLNLALGVYLGSKTTCKTIFAKWPLFQRCFWE